MKKKSQSNLKSQAYPVYCQKTSSKSPSLSSTLEENNNDENGCDLSSVQITKWAQEVIDDYYEKMKSV